MRRLVAVLVVVAVLVLAGCGVVPEREPRALDIPPPTVSALPEAEDGSVRLLVYFVRGARLEPVERSVSQPSAEAALALLVDGPTRAEVAAGMSTSVTPQSLTTVTSDSATGSVEIAATPELTSVSGGSQLLAVAQIVWTVTEAPGVRSARFTIQGKPLEVPTDRGLSLASVGRSDYLSVAPEPPPDVPEPQPSPTGTPTAPPTTPVLTD